MKIRTMEDRDVDRSEALWSMLTARSPGVEVMPSGYGSLKPSDVAGALSRLPRPNFLFGMASLAGDFSVLPELAASVEDIVRARSLREHWNPLKPQSLRLLGNLALFEHLAGKRCIVCRGEKVYYPDLEVRRAMEPHALSVHVQEQRTRAQTLRKTLRKLHHEVNVLERQAKTIDQNTRATEKRLKELQREILAAERMLDGIAGPRRCEECNGTGQLVLHGRHRAALIGISVSHWWNYWVFRYDWLFNELAIWRGRCLSHLAYGVRRPAEAAA